MYMAGILVSSYNAKSAKLNTLEDTKEEILPKTFVVAKICNFLKIF